MGWLRKHDDGNIAATLLKEHLHQIQGASFSPDGSRLVTFGDETVFIWTFPRIQCVTILRGHTGLVRSASFSTDGSQLITTSNDGTTRIWCLQTRKHLMVLEDQHMGFVLASSSTPLPSRKCGCPASQQLATAGWDGSVRLWNSTSGKCHGIIMEAFGPCDVSSPAFSADGREIVVSSSYGDPSACVYDIAGLRERLVAKLEGDHGTQVSSVCFSPDSDAQILTGYEDGTACIWGGRNARGKLQTVLKGHSAAVRTVDFGMSEFGGAHRVVTGSDDGTARIWEMVNDTDAEHCAAAVLEGHTGAVSCARFSPDGLWVATASEEDGSVRIWNSLSKRVLTVLESETELATADGFSVVTADDFLARKKKVAARRCGRKKGKIIMQLFCCFLAWYLIARIIAFLRGMQLERTNL